MNGYGASIASLLNLSAQGKIAPMIRRDGLPVWISDDDECGTTLSRVEFTAKTANDKYDEAWLQSLLFRHPSIFPIRQIEPGFERLIPACRELPVSLGAGKTGALDNFFITPDGNLVLVEAKLWRNPEARRVVIAQALDYASAVFRMSYSELDAAVKKARVAAEIPATSLFEIASAGGNGLDEVEFIDAVTRNLGRGKAVIAVVGDGIREDLISLSALLQGHAGQRFTFALVELAIYHASSRSGRVVVPSVLAQTVLLERGVIRIAANVPQGQGIIIESPLNVSPEQGARGGMSFGEDEFYDVLGQNAPGMPDLLRAFVEKAAALGVYPEVLGGLNLKHASPSGNPLNVGAIAKAGFVDFGPSTWWGNKTAARAYNETVAKLVGGSVIERNDGQDCVVRVGNNKMPRLSALLPRHAEAWLDAIQTYIRECLADGAKAAATTSA
jgi:hypothetical protein